MNSTSDTDVSSGSASSRSRSARRLRPLIGTGLLATVAAMAAATIAAALGQTVGVDLEIPSGGEAIPLSGIAFVTGVFSVVGVVIAAALLRWSARPAHRFVWTALTLTAVSLVPPLLSGARAEAVVTLIALHLIAAAVMIPALTRSLRAEGG